MNILFFVFNTDSLNKEIVDYVIKSLPGYDRYEVEVISQKSMQGFKLDNSKQISRSNNLVYVSVLRNEKSGRQVPNMVTCKVKLFKHVLIANRDIKRGASLNGNDFVFGEVDVTDLKNVFSDEKEIINKRSSSFIKKGEVLKLSLTEDLPIISNGDLVVLHSINGLADVQIDVTAQQEGYYDKTIRVKTRSNKLYKAKVIDSKNVLINE